MSWCLEQVSYAVGMIDVGRGGPYALDKLPPVVKECRDCHRAALSAWRQLRELGPEAVREVARKEELAQELRVLSAMAEQVCSADSAAAEQVFGSLDSDGNGSLGVEEQCAAIKTFDPNLDPTDLRFVLAYFYTSDSNT